MRFLRTLSKFLMIFPVVTLIYDLINEWFLKARLHVRSLNDWWSSIDQTSLSNGKSFMSNLLGTNYTEQILHAPAPLVLLVPPLVIYIIYRIAFAIRGGHGGGFTYKSHD